MQDELLFHHSSLGDIVVDCDCLGSPHWWGHKLWLASLAPTGTASLFTKRNDPRPVLLRNTLRDFWISWCPLNVRSLPQWQTAYSMSCSISRLGVWVPGRANMDNACVDGVQFHWEQWPKMTLYPEALGMPLWVSCTLSSVPWSLWSIHWKCWLWGCLEQVPDTISS
jgi:hypothetical protein